MPSLMRQVGTHTVAADVPTTPVPGEPPNPPGGPGDPAPDPTPSVPPAPTATFETVTGEGTAVDTLPLEPSLPLTLGVEFGQPTIFEADLGYETLVPRPGNGRRNMELVWFGLTDAQKTTLRTFIDTHTTEPWFWTVPGESVRSWRFATENGNVKIVQSEMVKGIHEIRVRIFEVL